MNDYNEEFWNALDELVETSEIVIDRPKGSIHPRFPDFIYRVDYGYLRDTSSMDGAGIDCAVDGGGFLMPTVEPLGSRQWKSPCTRRRSRVEAMAPPPYRLL